MKTEKKPEVWSSVESLIRNAKALLALDAKNALAPHGIGGHARGIIEGFLSLHQDSAIVPCDPVELNPARMSEMIARQYDVSNGAPNRT